MKAKMVIGVVVIVGALIYLMVSGFRDSSVYYMTVSELSGQKPEVINEGLRVSGYVDPQSIAWNAEKIELDFTLFEGSDSLRVHYKGVIPDQLADAQGVLAEGKLTADGRLEATRLMLKCPSKYEAKLDEKPGAGSIQ